MLTRIVILLLSCGALYPTEATRLRAFPTERDVLPARKAHELLQFARTDFELIRHDRQPRYAKFHHMLYDGGTTVYQGRGYTITRTHRIAGFRHRTAYYETGLGITLTQPITQRDLWYSEDGPRR